MKFLFSSLQGHVTTLEEIETRLGQYLKPVEPNREFVTKLHGQLLPMLNSHKSTVSLKPWSLFWLIFGGAFGVVAVIMLIVRGIIGLMQWFTRTSQAKKGNGSRDTALQTSI